LIFFNGLEVVLEGEFLELVGVLNSSTLVDIGVEIGVVFGVNFDYSELIVYLEPTESLII
jgi:hypothetical protein